MDVRRTSADERDAVLGLYAHASALQRSKGQVEWPAIDTALVEQEIEEGRQWHLRIDGALACVWVVAYEDPQIWGDMKADPSVFLHRIATAPEFKGRRLVGEVVAWAIDHARDLGRTHLRLDTVGHNEALIRLYTSHGFTFLGAKHLDDVRDLPGHYADGPCLRFEQVVPMMHSMDEVPEDGTKGLSTNPSSPRA